MRFLFFALVFSGVLSAAQMEWAEDFAGAERLAAAEGKVLYILITSPDCRWCKRFKRTTLTDADVDARLGRMAVGVEVERGSGTYPAHLKAPVIPMHYFLGADEKVLVKMPGYWNTEDFMSILDDVERKRK